MLMSMVALPSLSSDKIYCDEFTILPGENKSVGIILENDIGYSGFQADIILPEGLEFVIKDAEAVINASPRLSGFMVTSEFQSANCLRVLGLSFSHDLIPGKTGEIFYMEIHAADNFEGGALLINEISMSDENDNPIELPPFECRISSEEAVLIGDADDNGIVNINDAVTVVDFILGAENMKWNRKAADVDANGIININDTVGIVDIIISRN